MKSDCTEFLNAFKFHVQREIEQFLQIQFVIINQFFQNIFDSKCISYTQLIQIFFVDYIFDGVFFTGQLADFSINYIKTENFHRPFTRSTKVT